MLVAFALGGGTFGAIAAGVALALGRRSAAAFRHPPVLARPAAGTLMLLVAGSVLGMLRLLMLTMLGMALPLLVLGMVAMLLGLLRRRLGGGRGREGDRQGGEKDGLVHGHSPEKVL